MTTRTIILSAEHWQAIKNTLLNLCVDDPYVSPDLSAAYDALDAALAQPEPQGLTDKELLGCMLKAAALVPGGQCTGILDWDKEAIAAARAVIAADRARWGRPAIEPVPVSERPILKSSDFNDAEGRCWCGTTAFTDERGDLPIDYPMAWELREPCAQDDCVLPHWALPMPTSQEATDA